jgi:hypothetical protein
MCAASKRGRFGLTQKQIAFYTLVVAVFALLSAWYFASRSGDNQIKLDNSSNNQVYQLRDNAVVNLQYFQSGQELYNFDGLEIIDANIVDAQSGYMKIKIDRNFLNKGIDDPVTLSYKHGIYQPVLLTFRNDPEGGPCINFVSPEHSRPGEVCLRKIKAFGAVRGKELIWLSDCVCEIYYDERYLLLAGVEGELEWRDSRWRDRGLTNYPTITFGTDFRIWVPLGARAIGSAEEMADEFLALKSRLRR